MVRIGLGFDSHPFQEGRRLLLGGVDIPSPEGLKGHSDADPLLHAITDAILGAIGEKDIGELFPNTDPRWKDAPSQLFLEKALSLAREKGFRVVNLDCVIVADRPKISPYKDTIRENLSRLLGVKKENISIKGKTREGFCPDNGIACMCVVLLEDEG
ncbi:2-C-methyl-D-erythritol 2,4-cyclodiphosphate synthase [Thermocrinis minervae]|uniref:2-C-methyl-D-erythritol 2,4-cyclodiphosphate synthase n=1 Tax=Thermocrinis minervae TaxID=381751 RepID=A0A1M6SQ31_9AQUI|nr:2-C-methyl-D-erythritol 2,4-cyclodiphosphate synthase [Thermocrinis minervae]SHK46740.1 2-C-methyl-D-erythritol 2,4-cyclodiphosphate synthase [Thermocrinis minervae]